MYIPESILIFIFLAVVVIVFYVRETSKSNFIHYWKKQINESSLNVKDDFSNYFEKHCNTMSEYKIYKSYLTEARQKKVLDGVKECQERDKRLEDFTKKEFIPKRVFAYEYEDFLFSLFSSTYVYFDFYGEWSGYCPEDKMITEDYILEKIISQYNLSKEEARALFLTFLKNDLICSNRTNNKFKLGATLTTHANIISLQDMNVDKWMKKQGN